MRNSAYQGHAVLAVGVAQREEDAQDITEVLNICLLAWIVFVQAERFVLENPQGRRTHLHRPVASGRQDTA